MSGQSTTWFRQQRLRQTFRGEALGFTRFEVALTRKVPASNAANNQLDEFLQNGYARATIDLGAANWTLVNGVEMTNAVRIQFPRAGGTGWGTIHGWALIAQGPGMVCAVGTLVEPLRAVGGIRPGLPPSSIVFSEID